MEIREFIDLGKEIHKLTNMYYKEKASLQKEGCLVNDNDLLNIIVDDSPKVNRLAKEDYQKQKVIDDKIKRANELEEKNRKALENQKKKGN